MTASLPPPKFPSIDEAAPLEEGGPIARSGFNYQDEIAVSFLIDLLENPAIEQIHCETHDDIVIVWRAENGNERKTEFVQVKSDKLNQLWSATNICARDGGAVGTSLFERSLARDRLSETSIFRIVTFRPVVKELEVLSHALASQARKPGCSELEALKNGLNKRCPGVKSPKGNQSDYWLANCYWDQRHTEEAVRDSNLKRILQLSSSEGTPLLYEPAEQILDDLRDLAKKAASSKWADGKTKKIITWKEAREWWEARLEKAINGESIPSGGKLLQKMGEAGLSDDLKKMATELRRSYSANIRTSKYMDSASQEKLLNRVRSEISTLRARYFAGEIEASPAEFHALCSKRMDALSNERPAGTEDYSAFLKGCMYDIADRCLMRFTKQSP